MLKKALSGLDRLHKPGLPGLTEPPVGKAATDSKETGIWSYLVTDLSGIRPRQEPVYRARHLQRLEIVQGALDAKTVPLFPAPDGSVLSKSQMIASVRATLKAAGVQATRPDESGVQVERFTGHILRVAGTQHLYLLGLRFDMVQLHGRWSSLAVQKYLQDAPLLVVPSVVARALSSSERRGS
eukprot:s2442_g6.t1